jgi:ADP-glucose pyrophosphorylase
LVACLQGSNSPSPSRQSSPGARIEEGSSMYLASTGILIINRQVMVDLLRKHQDAMDFGERVSQ